MKGLEGMPHKEGLGDCVNRLYEPLMRLGVGSLEELPLSPLSPNRRDPRSGVVGLPVRMLRITDD